MNIKLLIVCFIIVFTSCARQGTFQHFYNQHKRDTDLAIALPKYLAMVAVPKEDKREIQYFSRGMKKIRVLYDRNTNDHLMSDLSNLVKNDLYTPYVVAKKDGDEISLYTREEEGFIREIILNVSAEEESFVVGILGKMDKRTFGQALSKAKKEL